MTYFIVRYWSGFKNYRCLIVADSEEETMVMFFKSHPGLRQHNVIGVATTTNRIYQLAER